MSDFQIRQQGEYKPFGISISHLFILENNKLESPAQYHYLVATQHGNRAVYTITLFVCIKQVTIAPKVYFMSYWAKELK